MIDRYTKAVLTVIAISLSVIAFKMSSGGAVMAQLSKFDPNGTPVYITNRSLTVDGKVVVTNSPLDPLFVATDR